MDRDALASLGQQGITAVTLNGDRRELPTGSTIADLVDLVYATHTIAIARNGEVVPRSTWSSTALENADRLEVLSVAPGG